MLTYLQILVYGLVNGALYGLVGLGLSLVFGVMSFLNVAHGAIIMIAAYASLWAFRGLHLDPFLSVLLLGPAFFGLGLGLYKAIYHRLSRYPEPAKVRNSLLVSFGMLLILTNLVILLFTADERAVATTYSGSVVEILGIRLPYVGLGTLALVVVVTVALDLFLNRTYFGKAIRAASLDHEAAAMQGIDVAKTYLLSFGIGTALAVAPGAVVALASFNPSISFELTNKALVVIVLGGVGSVNGVMLGGLALGLAEAVGVLFGGTTYREVIGLVLFVLVLMVRPQGLFGRST
ncbi:MAG: branched-chain amino acid ABC transporter permease [Deltaproteobacteria bacterium]|nr:branched-chain amino acid ABC transporter permease [Deltaproteobacteria bacterium]